MADKTELLQQKATLESRIASLTSTLKEMSSDSPSYGRVWDDRVDLKYQLAEIEKQLS